jgi:hypothetical protein
MTEKQATALNMRLPPSVGTVGSVLFFVALFSLSNPDREGYEQFRRFHGNCANGYLHAIGMPMAVSGVFLLVRSASDGPNFTRHLQLCVTTAYLYLYMQFEALHPLGPALFWLLYMGIFEFVLYRKLYSNPALSRIWFLQMGVFLIAFNVLALETLGHGFYEKHHSHVLEFFNSVFHTPLYGVNSLLGLVTLRADHVCW